MKYSIVLILFLLLSCKHQISNTISKNNGVATDSSNRIVDFNYEKIRTYSKNPIWLRSKKICFDSLSAFFKYKNIKRLDLLTKKMMEWEVGTLKEVVFFDKWIHIKYHSDTIFLGDFQFIVGNLKANKNRPNVLVILNSYEDWGHDLILISVDNNCNIIDVIRTYEFGGDGGDFNETILTRKSDDEYFFVNKSGYQTFTEPIDTTTFTKSEGLIKINANGTFLKQILLVDSNIVKIEKIRKR